MVMTAAGIDPLVARSVPAHVDLLDQPESLELLERPVDGGPAHIAAVGRSISIAVSAHALLSEQIDHLPAASAAAKPRLEQRLIGLARSQPSRVCCIHATPVDGAGPVAALFERDLNPD